ncbi:MAG: hypothetical protein JW869_06005 [Candidatus Omnitrophica bacterium]|nr:hypothetical protein [Candidatus Omnitrophota bacterium]
MNILSQYIWALGTTSVVLFILAIFVYIRNPRNKVNWTFSLYSLSIAIWSGCEAYSIAAPTPELGLLFWRINHAAVIFIPIFFIHFVLNLLNQEEENRRLIVVSYLLGLIFLALDATPLLIASVTPKFSFKHMVEPGLFYIPLCLLWMAGITFGLVKLFAAYSKSSGMRRNQLKYLCWTSLVGYIGGPLNFLPAFNIELFPLMPFGTYGIPLYGLAVTYAILKYRLIDINLARSYVAIYISYGLISLTLFIIPIMLLRHSTLGVIFLVLGAILLAPFLYFRMENFLRSTFLREKLQTWNGLDKLKESNPGYISEQIAWNLVGGISETLHIAQISLFLEVARYKELRPYAQIGLDDEIGTEQIPWVTLKPDSALVKQLSRTEKLVIKDEIGDGDSKKLKEEMGRLRAEISVPLFVQEKLIGILNLGPKPNGEMYHQEELKKITDLCHQAENHLSHARFMENRATFSRQLAHDMKNLVAKNIDPTFAELCEAKDDKKRQELLNTVFNQHQYLKICLKNNFDLVSLVEKLAYHKYILEPAQITRVITACSQLYKTPCAKIGISMEQDVPKNLPEILVNREDIPKVFNNLFDNALKFTLFGGRIKIRAERKDGEVLITFSDTGRGMSEEKLKTIFDPNVKMPDNEEGVGTGLGLVIVKDIIEAHGGRIWVKSEPGKGTTFYFTLRIAKENNEKNEEEV